MQAYIRFGTRFVAMPHPFLGKADECQNALADIPIWGTACSDNAGLVRKSAI